ncbi:cilia- and flagella-associated protein 57-like [Amia ocellicauda]|uniref:cilia- and flagella-associated protein 57-like n=1 Tax=Amia ocellicauda TaxID=2972642 RepID=UPI003463E925
MAISPNRRYLAVSEMGDKGTITVYDLKHEQHQKKKVLSAGDFPMQEFVSLAFSPDSKYLIGQSGAPDWTLYYWMWEKHKVMASVKTSITTSPVYQVSFNPQNNTQICVSGRGVFKLYHYAEGALKQSNSQKLDVGNVLSHAWLSDKQVILGTETGRLLMMEGGDLRCEMSVAPKPTTRDSHRSQKKHVDEPVSDALYRISAIATYVKGFACATGPGTVCLFEKTEGKERYRKTRVIRIPQDQCSNDPSNAEQQEIATLCFSPSEEILIASTDRGQLYSFTLSSAEMSKEELVHFELLSHSFHSGPITGLSICIRKPLVATCSLDRSVRIWNYETNDLELYKEFNEEAYSIALHPSGLYVLVGFSDKLLLMNLLIDDIQTFREFNVHKCREVAFSHGGHMFAAANGNVIHLFSTTTFENTQTLQGHRGKVRAIEWSKDDSRLVSCGMDGAVYEWNTLTSKRESDSVLKSCSYTGVTLSPDSKTVFAVGTDCTLKEITDSQILREMQSHGVPYTNVVMSRSGRMLFAGTSTGTIRAIKYPLPVQKDWVEYQAHAAPVTKMAITHDDQFLLTSSEDGCLLVWKINDMEGRGLKWDTWACYTKEVLITKSDLEEKKQVILELKMKVENVKRENQCQLQLQDKNNNDKIKKLTQNFIQEVESLKTKNQVLRREMEKQALTHEEATAELMEKHSKELQDLESSKMKMFIRVYEQNYDQQVKSQHMEADFMKQLHLMEHSKTKVLEEMTGHYEAKLQEKLQMLKQCQEELRQKECQFMDFKKTVEEDADSEIMQIRSTYETLIQDMKDTNLKLKTDIGIIKAKVGSLQKKVTEGMEDIDNLQTDNQKLQEVITFRDKDILILETKIQERDETIKQKEKCIGELKNKIQSLDQLKYVLEYKIKELKEQIEPTQKAIRDMKEQKQEMDVELRSFNKRNYHLKLDVTALNLKLKTMEKEMKKEKQRVRDLQAEVKRFKTDLHNCVGFIQEPRKLKHTIQEMYHKYVQLSDVVEIEGMDADVQRESVCQREHMEINVAMLKKQLAKDSENHRAQNTKSVQENSSLIQEINNLRCELKLVQTPLHDKKATTELNRKKQSCTELRAVPAVDSPSAVTKTIFDLRYGGIQHLRQEIKAQGHSHTRRSPHRYRLPVLTL